MILTIRTDKPETEIGLYQGATPRAYKKWLAHRQLGATIHEEIKELLDSIELDWKDIEGVVYYKGPGSFTGLRIGASVANALAASSNIPLTNQGGQNWIEIGLKTLAKGQNEIALPEYGSEPHTTTPKK